MGSRSEAEKLFGGVMKWLPKTICGFFYHRFGYKSDYCVRCGISYDEADGSADGSITSSEYDPPNQKENER